MSVGHEQCHHFSGVMAASPSWCVCLLILRLSSPDSSSLCSGLPTAQVKSPVSPPLTNLSTADRTASAEEEERAARGKRDENEKHLKSINR